MDKHTESRLLRTYSPEQLERLKAIEKSSKQNGLLCVGSVVGVLFYVRKLNGGKVSKYYAGILSLLSGLSISQFATHYLFVRDSDQIRFERRMIAAKLTEASKRTHQ